METRESERVRLLGEIRGELQRMLDAARPTLAGRVVDETTGSLPIMHSLERTISRMKAMEQDV